MAFERGEEGWNQAVSPPLHHLTGWMHNRAMRRFVEYGNVRFSVSRTGALLLADGLHYAVQTLTVAQYTGHEENNLLTYSEED